MKSQILAAAVSGLVAGIQFYNVYTFECYDKDGNLKWVEEVKNLVTNAGLNDVLDKYLKGSSYTAAFYVGLKSTGTPDATDTMSSHSTWTEITGYDESARPTLTLGSVASQSVSNSASKAQFTFNASATIAGAFVGTNSTKGGTSGVLFGVANFSTNRPVVDDDVLNVTVTITAASV